MSFGGVRLSDCFFLVPAEERRSGSVIDFRADFKPPSKFRLTCNS